MSNDTTKRDATAGHLTTAQKETARRLGMTEKEYASNTAELIKRGKIKREDLR